MKAIITAFLLAFTGVVASFGQGLDCEYRPASYWTAELNAAVERGEIEDPGKRKIPPIRPGSRGTHQEPAPAIPTLTTDDLFLYEDTNQLLLTDFSDGQLLDFINQITNAVMAVHGDNFDFVGYWLSFQPHHTVGQAFYSPVENHTSGIGDLLYNNRPERGIGGDNIEGLVMMWNINSGTWQPGMAPSADFTRLALGQEFEHRWAMLLPDLLDGRTLQGNNGSCGRIYHWNWKVDGQGSAMEIREWVGSPPQLQGNFVTFNTDIAGGMFSYPDLYLMGYVSPAEMDAGMSELRYMEDSFCALNETYLGTLSTFDSNDVIASAGPRAPDWTTAQRHFRTAWVMIHLPDVLPTQFELDKAIAIMQQHQTDWNTSTLGRGTMNNSLVVMGTGIPAVSSWSVAALVLISLLIGSHVLKRRAPRRLPV